MGRIKSTLIKRTARKLMEESDLFSDKFEENKKTLGNSMPSKRIRNMVAGYVTRLKRQEKDNVKQ